MKTVKIRDLGRTVTGHTPPTSESKYFGDYMPFVKPTDISKDSKYTYNPEQYYSEEAAEKYKTSMIPKGSTCVVCIGTIGEKMTMAHCDMFTNQSINTIVPSEDYDPDYVYYLLKYNLGKVKALNKGTASGREYVSKSTFLDMPVEVFEDKSVQESIGKILSAYDAKIESVTKEVKLIEENAQLLYKEWFTNLRCPYLSDNFQDNGLPNGWSIATLGDIAYDAGVTAKKQNRNDFCYYLPIDCMPKKSLCYTVVDDVSLAESSLQSFQPGDIVMGAMRPYFHKVIIARDKGLTRNTCFVINAKDKSYWAYLALLIFSEDTIKYASQISVGATMPYVRWGDFVKMPIVIPSKEVADKFSEIITPMIERINTLAVITQRLIEARNILLPKLISGEVSI